MGISHGSSEETDCELKLNLSVRIAQGIVLFISGLTAREFCIKNKNIEKQGNSPVVDIENVAIKSWLDIQDSSEATECCICLAEFENDHQVIQLSCHSTHVYHRDCLR